jgi:periplasmic protein CpxP/Spy
MSDTESPRAPELQRRWRWARRALIGGGVTLALAVPTAMVARGHGGHWFGGAGMHADLPSAQEWLALALRQTLRRLDATPEQHAKVQLIAERALADLYPLREQHHRTRDAALALLRADTVDRAAAERLRAEQIALHEQASKRMMQAVLDAAEVLTPAQRDALAKDLAERRWRRH